MDRESAFRVPSILVEQSTDGLRLIRRDLAPDQLQATDGAPKLKFAVVHLVCENQLPSIRTHKAPFLDCGRKHPAKPLSSILLGRDGIPVLAGGFKNSGQLLRSLRTLLQNAADADDRNRFIIGVSEVLFEQLQSQAQPDVSDKIRVENDDLEQPLTMQSLLEIMPWREVPPALEKLLIGISPQIQFTRQLILQAGQHDGPVLIIGDTGTGKELVARAIHVNSKAKEMGFFPVNCGAISKELLESELFGHKKGAFTGAHADKEGLWKAADNGTLFLDEVGDLPMEHQVKVLRALDTQLIRPVGETHEIPVNARVIAATNRDLPAMMKAGLFRADLYYRLRSFMVPTEPLSKHPQDIPLLARHFWKDIAKVPGAALSDEFVKALQAMPWHGNVRDLKWTLVSLFRYTGLGNPTPKHLRIVVWYENQQDMPHSPAADKLSIDAHRVECVMHLRLADDVLRACEVVIQPVLARKRLLRQAGRRAEDALRRHAGELQILCLHPLLFTDNGTFKAVEQFKCGLVGFLHVLQTHPTQAKDFWDKQLSAAFNAASKSVFRQVDRLVKG